MNKKAKHASPLRYPGGKSKISTFLEDILLLNDLEGCTLYELYAGGAGASLNVLFSGLCDKIVLNDLDEHIYSFWYAILNHTEDFIKMVHDTSVNMKNWYIQKDIYDNYEDFDILKVGFSTFFLNRANRSGILFKAGPIGGRDQTGNFKIDARFNKPNLISRITKIAIHRHKIKIFNCESKILLKKIFRKKNEKQFLFLDPPYYKQGENLYLNFYTHSDHLELKKILEKRKLKNWMLTYDNCTEIKCLYNDFRRSTIPMTYTLEKKRKAKEVVVFSNNLFLPKTVNIGSANVPFKVE